MKVFRGLESLEKLSSPIVTAGTFDGVHKGHQTIINRLKSIAKESSSETLLITYDPHPRLIVNPDTEIELLTSIDERICLLEDYGLDNLLIIPFTKEFSRLSSVDFIKKILVEQINTKKLVIGYDHQFGRNREGSFEHLKEYAPVYGFELEEIKAQDIDNINISSTKIREALHEGNIELANKYLGHSYSIEGTVIEGNQIGRTIGFPTANILVEDSHKLIPKDGVYEVEIEYNNKVKRGMLNIGHRPTINDSKKRTSIEVHIFDESNNLYDSNLVLKLKRRIRSEIKFSGIEQLKEQLIKDKEFILNGY